MPNRKKKDHKCGHHTSGSGSHWQNFHFSGKLIVCSVIFGFMLILIGGIVYAIGMDRDDDTKSDDYEDLQKKPPMAIVGPVMMGIGGFIVFVGVGMCLVETNVCRKRNVENSPLIDGESGPKDSEATGVESDPTAIPSSSHRHRDGHRKKSPSPKRAKLPSKKAHFTKDRHQESISPTSPSSAPIDVSGNSAKNFLSASDKFLTPPSSFMGEMQTNSRDAENQTSSSLMQSFISSGNSWITSTEFQTPTASSIENSMSLESSKLNYGMQDKSDPNTSTGNNHKYLTPKNSYAEVTIPVEVNVSQVLIHNDPLKQNCSDASYKAETQDSSDASLKAETQDSSDASYKAETQDSSDASYKAETQDSSDASYKAETQDCSDAFYKAETQDREIKQHLESQFDAPIAVSVKEIAEPEAENLESECNSIEEPEPVSSEENIEPREGVIESSSIIGEDASEKEISNKRSEGIPSDSLLKQGTEQIPTNQELLKELDKKCELTNTDIQVNKGNQGVDEVVSKSSEESSDLNESDTSSRQIVGTNNQKESDDSQEKDSESKSFESVEKITESESANDVSESSRKDSLNNNDT